MLNAKWWMVVLLLGLALPAAAQETDTTASEEQVGPQVVRIPQSELADQTEELAVRIRSARDLLATAADREAIESQWPDFRSELSELKIQSTERVDETSTTSRLDEYIRRWDERYGKLEDWENQLSDRISELTEYIDEFSGGRVRWALTRDLAVADSLPQATIVQLDSVLFVTDRTVRELRADRDLTLDLQTRMTYENIDALSSRERLVRLRGAALTRSFSDQRMPIWELFAEDGESVGLGVMPRILQDGDIAVDYIRNHVGHLGLQFGLILLLAFLFRPLRQRLLEIEEERGLNRIRVGVFERPILPAILIALLATPFIYPSVPGSVVGFTTIISVPLTLVMLMQSVRPRGRGLVRGIGFVVGYFVLARVIVPADGILDRLSMTFLAAATAVLTGLFLLRSPLVSEMRKESLFGRILLVIARIGFVLSTFVFVADFLGYVAIADHTLRGMMIGLYSGLYIWVGSQVMNGSYIAFLRTRFARRSRSIRNHADDMGASGVSLINFAAFVYWLYISLGLLSILDPIMDAAGDVLNQPWGVGQLEISFIDIIAFVLTLWIAIRLSRIIRILLDEDIMGRMNLERGLSTAVSSLAFYAMVALGFAFALSAAGVPLDRLALITGALGFGIGFGLQDVVRNFISGLILMIERPVKVGDVVEFGVQAGTIKKVGIRSSIVRIWEGADVIVPNSHLVTNEVKNWTMDDSSLRIDVNIIVTYDSDQHRVAEILQSVGDDYDGVARNPAPTVVFTGFTERGMNFSLRCWVHERDGWLDKRTDLAAEAHRSLREAGVEFPKIPL